MTELNKCTLKLHWTVSIGAKWQIVIPKEVRDIIWINPWDTLMIFTKWDKWIWIVKSENLNELIQYITKEMNEEENEKEE